MGRAPCCEKEGLRRGAWSPEEDQRLVAYIQQNGHPNWRALPRQAGLLRCGKSCRLRWINYLRPDIKRGNFSADEEALIVRLHRELGNRWSAIAAQLPGRTDNEIKNVWHTHIKKRLEDGDDGEDKKKAARKSKPAAAAKRSSAAKKTADANAVDNNSEQQQPFLTASPGLSSSVSSGVTTFSTATDSAAAVSSADNAATTSHQQEQEQEQEQEQLGASKAEMDMEMESFISSAEFPPIDDTFWSSADVMDMGLGAMDEELGLALAGPPSSSTRDEDMEFWLKMLLEAGDMRDLSVL
ncbi:transcription factor MYB4 [Sorghum bicolor]|uniref:Uncharacterized protein n=1 Tax=Sorghum bicolor TaxID=4558 RepID=C5WYF1_SORBI|nr:transcription factor MYB4 [Sorghum bicolor]EER91482.1 hypothetical protein SORBI_3001G219200 [Sorghum bicolor]|eukprot:XP_002464484.1 transcription factor MYB4 [Sorghum bicolor]